MSVRQLPRGCKINLSVILARRLPAFWTWENFLEFFQYLRTPSTWFAPVPPFSSFLVCPPSFYPPGTSTHRSYELSTQILRAVPELQVFYSGFFWFPFDCSECFLTSWSETHSLIFFWSGYFDSGWLLPLWTQYLSRTVLGVAAPLAEPTKTSRPCEATHKTSFWGWSWRKWARCSLLLLGDNLPRQLGSRVQNNRFHQLKQVVFGKI